MRGHIVAVGLLKSASKAEAAGEAVGKFLHSAYHGSRAVGRGIAKGVGADPVIGERAGAVAAVGAGVSAAGAAKRRIDDARYRYAYGG